jgi:hypothetical protein
MIWPTGIFVAWSHPQVGCIRFLDRFYDAPESIIPLHDHFKRWLGHKMTVRSKRNSSSELNLRMPGRLWHYILKGWWLYRPVRKYMPQPHSLGSGVRLSSYHISRVCTIWKVK